ncbi:MAG: glycosyltransferase family 4 protein [Acinetobacter sp.]|nr:glycosyltransferase family 4 protein [Acinetobacter sp.]
MITPYYASHGGGVEIVAGKLANWLVKKKWQLTWIASSNLDPLDERKSCRISPVKANNWVEEKSGVPFPIWGPSALCQLWKECKAADVIIVHESLYIPSMYATLIARMCKRPILLVQHISFVPYRKFWLRAILGVGNLTWTRLIHRLATKKVYISTRVMHYFESTGSRNNFSLIPNGVDADIFSFNPHYKKNFRPRILFVGRFVEKKGLDILQKLAQYRKDLDFFLAGDGPLRPENWAQENVHILGKIDPLNLAKEYRVANILLLPSHGEGFPLVVQEAMATGLAPVISDETASSLPDIEDHVYNAPVDRSNPRLIEQWSALIDRALAAEQDGLRSISRAKFAKKHWSWDHCAEKYDHLLISILDENCKTLINKE